MATRLPCFFFLLILTYFFFFIEVELIYNVVLVSGIWHSDSDVSLSMYFFSRFFSLIGYLKILDIVPCATQ